MTVLKYEARLRGLNAYVFRPRRWPLYLRTGFQPRFSERRFPLREIVEDTFDWLTTLCGLDASERAPRHLRVALRHLGSPNRALRLRAETSLLQGNPGHVASLLRGVVRARTPVVPAIRAALLLHQMRDRYGAELLRYLVLDSALRTGQYSEMLRRAANLVLDPHHYIRQATSALARLEQRPDSVTAITSFRHAADVLCFLRAPIPFAFLERALFVRAVGGENLSLVREVLRGTQGVAIEHVCLIRKEAVLLLLHQPDRERACVHLMQALAHPNPAVQLTTMYGLAEMRDPRAIDALLPIASDPNSPVRDEAQELIARLGQDAPDVLTLLRAAPRHLPPPEELLRPTRPEADDPRTLLRPRRTKSTTVDTGNTGKDQEQEQSNLL